jgi:superfamily II DNA or RNA helicase
VTRKDGHQPIIFMQCGPVRYRVDARKQAAARPFDHHVVFRRSEFRFERKGSDDKPSIQDLYAALAADRQRNDMIFNDILSTGRYLGEGFDDARLDTLFLTMPIA